MLTPRSSSLALALTFVVGACSLKDYSYLQEGDQTAEAGGRSNKGGAAGQGGGSSGGKAEAGSAGLGGREVGGATSTGIGGSGTAKGGTTSSGGSASGGTSAEKGGSSGAATGGSISFGGAVSVPLGPWEFNSPAEVSVDWKIQTAGTLLGWEAQGQTQPLGAMRLDGAAKNLGETLHNLPGATDLTTYTYGISVRGITGSVTVQIFATDSTYRRGLSPAVSVDETSWVTLELPLASPNSTNGAYDVTRIGSIGIAVSGATSTALIDRAWLLNNASGGASSAGGSGSAGTPSTAGATGM